MADTDQKIKIGPWKGLNLREDAGVISDSGLSSCINFNIGRAGELVRRTGFEMIHDSSFLGLNTVKLIGHFITETYSQLLARIGSNLYYSNDGIAWILIGAYSVDWGVQYAGTFYMVRGNDTILTWTGTGTPTAITGSPSGDFCIIHKERLFVFNSAGAGVLNSRVYFSVAGDLSATGWIGTNTFDVRSGYGDFLTSAAIVNDILILFKTNSTWGLYVQGTSSADWVLRSLNAKIGCVSKYSVRVVQETAYFVGTKGIYRTNGSSFVSISDDLQNLMRDRVITLSSSNIDAAFYWDEKYVVLLRLGENIVRYFAYNTKLEGWTEWVIAGGYRPSYFVEVDTNIPNLGVYAGDMNLSGHVFRFGKNVYTDGAEAYSSSFRTKDFDFGHPSTMKRGKWLAADTLGAATLTYLHTVNSEFTTQYTATTVALSKSVKMRGPGFFRTWSLTVTVTDSTVFQLFGLMLYTHLKRSQIGASV